MARKGIEIPILADSSELVKELKTGSKSVEELGQVLDDLGRDGDQAGEKVERSLEEVQKEAEKTGSEFKDLGRTADAAFRGIGQDADKAGDRVQGSMHRSVGNARENIREVKSEALQNAAETFSSFDGSVSSFADGVQGTFGGLIASLPAAGAAAAAIAAIVFGGVTAELAKQDEQAKQLRIRLAGMYTDAVTEGRTYLDQAAIIREAQDVLLNPERRDEYNRALNDSKKLAIDANTVLLAQAGDQESLNVVLAAAAEKQDAFNKKVAESSAPAAEASAAKTQEARDIKDLTSRYGALADEHERLGESAAHAAELAASAQKGERDQIKRTSDADQARYAALAAAQAAISKTPPANLAVTLSTPDIGAAKAGMQRALNSSPLYVPVKYKDGYGKVF